MPELPEVETVRRQLEPVLVGKTITDIQVLREKSFSGDVSKVIGGQIVAVKRKAKMIFVQLSHSELDSESSFEIPACAVRPDPQHHAMRGMQVRDDKGIYLMIHLKMTGQLIYEEKIRNSKIEILNVDKSNFHQNTSKPENQLTNSLINQTTQPRIVGGHPNNSWTNQLPDSHTRVIIELNKGTLFFNDQRVFGWVKQVESEWVNEFMGKLPPDIIDPECDPKYFYKILQSSGRAVKLVILDSQKVGGIGNIYACDGLYLAGIDPQKTAKNLTKSESKKLLESLKHVVNKGIELGGATAADGKFVNTLGMGGKYQDEFLVYEQTGKIRKRNGKQGIVQKFKQAGRGTYWVSELQK